MVQTPRGISGPSWNWLSADVFYLQISVIKEIYGVVIWLQSASDRTSESRPDYEHRTERMLDQFIVFLKKTLKGENAGQNHK